MRIAFIVNQFPVLSETFILNQITGLIDRGHHVDIYADRPINLSKVHPAVESYKLTQRIYYSPDKPRNQLVRLSKGLRLIVTHFRLNPQLLLNSLNVIRHGKTAASLTLLYWVIPFLAQSQTYDIIHCHFGPVGVKGEILRRINVLSGSLITTFYGYDISTYLKTTDKQVYDCLFLSGDKFLAISEYMRSQLVELNCDPTKILIHKLGVELDKFVFIPRTLEENRPIRVATLARLVEKKGVEYGIKAVAKLVHSGAKLHYDIVGDGPLREQLEDLIQQLDVAGSVRLLGWKNQVEVVEILKNADLFLAPSVTSKDGDQEGTPTVLIEAMAMGLPIISTYHSGIPELIQDGISGFLVPERDVDALAEKLSFLIEHPEMWTGMGRAGRTFVESNHDIDKLSDQLVQIYQKLLVNKKIEKSEIDEKNKVR